MFFGQPALVLGLQVQAPFDREVELLARVLQQLHRFGVVDLLERSVDEAFQLGDRVLVHALGQEGQVVATLIEHRAEQVLQELLGQARIFGQIGEGDFRLDHPELRQMAGGVGVLGAEGRAERVDLAQRQAVRLDVQLAGHGQEGFLAEEIAAEIHLALFVARQVGHVQRRDPEHLAGALGIGRGHDRGADPVEAVLVEEPVHGLGQAVADAGDRTEQVRARAQVRHFAQELRAHRLGLDRVGQRVFDQADDLDVAGLDLEGLALALGFDQGAAGDHRAARGQALDVVEISQGVIGHHLDGGEAGAIGDIDEGKRRRAAHRADPSAYCCLAAFRDLPGKRMFNADHRHDLNPLLIDSISEHGV